VSPVGAVVRILKKDHNMLRPTPATIRPPCRVTKSPSAREVVDSRLNHGRLNGHAFTRSCGLARCRRSAANPSASDAGEPRPTAPTLGAKPIGQYAGFPPLRPGVLGNPQHVVVTKDERAGDRAAAVGCPMASGRVPALLALEIAAAHRSHTH
jgi:hypothetical protein